MSNTATTAELPEVLREPLPAPVERRGQDTVVNASAEVANLEALRPPPSAPERVLALAEGVSDHFLAFSNRVLATHDPRVFGADSWTLSQRAWQDDLEDAQARFAAALATVEFDLELGQLEPQDFGKTSWAEVDARSILKLADQRMMSGEGIQVGLRLVNHDRAQADLPPLDLDHFLFENRSLGSSFWPKSTAHKLSREGPLAAAIEGVLAVYAPHNPAEGHLLPELAADGAPSTPPGALALGHWATAYAQASGTAGAKSALGVVHAAAELAGIPMTRLSVADSNPSKAELERLKNRGEILDFAETTARDGTRIYILQHLRSAEEIGLQLRAMSAEGQLDHVPDWAHRQLDELFALSRDHPGQELDQALAAQKASLGRRSFVGHVSTLVALSILSAPAGPAGGAAARWAGAGAIGQSASAVVATSVAFTSLNGLIHQHAPGFREYLGDALMFAGLAGVGHLARSLSSALPGVRSLPSVGQRLASEGFVVASVATGMLAYDLAFLDNKEGRTLVERFGFHLTTVSILHAVPPLLGRLGPKQQKEFGEKLQTINEGLVQANQRMDQALRSGSTERVREATEAMEQLGAKAALLQAEVKTTVEKTTGQQVKLENPQDQAIFESRSQVVDDLYQRAPESLKTAMAGQDPEVLKLVIDALAKRGTQPKPPQEYIDLMIKIGRQGGANLKLATELAAKPKLTKTRSEKPLPEPLKSLAADYPQAQLRKAYASKASPAQKARMLELLKEATNKGQIHQQGLLRWLRAMAGVENPSKAAETMAELERASELVRTGQVQGKLVMTAKRGESYWFGEQKVKLEENHPAEIDLLYLGTDGKMHGVEVKHTLAAGRDKIQNKKRGNPAYFERLGKWGNEGPNRVAELYIATDKNPYDLLAKAHGKPRLVDELLDRRVNLHVAGRDVSSQALEQFRNAAEAIKPNPSMTLEQVLGVNSHD